MTDEDGRAWPAGSRARATRSGRTGPADGRRCGTDRCGARGRGSGRRAVGPGRAVAAAAAAPAGTAPAPTVAAGVDRGSSVRGVVAAPVPVAARTGHPPRGAAAAAGPASPASAADRVGTTAPAAAAAQSPPSLARFLVLPTVLNTGNPADAASARVAASPATIDSRFSLVMASRASRRKLMREVATREP